MKVSGSAVLHGPPERVFAAVTDPAVLAAVIPGCDVLTPVADNRFALTVTLGVASIKGSYSGEVTFADLIEPASLTMRANGSGAPGTIDTTVAVGFTALADGSTRVDYDADATVGGMVGGVGQRVLNGVAKKTAGLFFAAIDDVLTGTRAVTPAAVPALTAGLETGFGTEQRPVPPAQPAAPAAPPGPRSLLGAAAFGAVSMLVGVLVGARIGARIGRRTG